MDRNKSSDLSGWLRSVTSLAGVVLFLFALPQAKTPAEGALCGTIATAMTLGTLRLINLWEAKRRAAAPLPSSLH